MLGVLHWAQLVLSGYRFTLFIVVLKKMVPGPEFDLEVTLHGDCLLISDCRKENFSFGNTEEDKTHLSLSWIKSKGFIPSAPEGQAGDYRPDADPARCSRASADNS